MSIKCPCCNSGAIEVVGEIPPTDSFAGRTLSFLLDGNRLYSCRACSFYFRYPRMKKDEMDKLYRAGDEENWVPKTNDQRKDWKIATRWMNSTRKKQRILDIGCFSGEFLRSLGGGFELYGIEIHQQAADRARQGGVEILGNDFSALELMEKSFDVVTLFDVVEHVYNPKSFLMDIIKITKRNGTIIISTGSTMALSWKLLGSRYWYCTIAEHVSFINPDWCKSVAKDFGLEIDNIEYFSHSGNTSLFIKIKEIVINLCYKFFPSSFHLMRKVGAGGKDVEKFAGLLDHPPGWMSAKDHFIVRFRKIDNSTE